MSSAPRVHIGPDDDERLRAAVERAGGERVPLEDAEAVVWLGDPDALRGRLHPGVRWVQIKSAGTEDWLRSGVLARERTWTSAAGAYAPQVAEHALALLLALARRVPEAPRSTRWESRSGRSLRGATVAIVGAGGIGRALIELLAPLGIRVVAVTRSGREVDGEAESLPADRLAATSRAR